MKKKMLIAFLVFTFLMMAVVPPAANARNGREACILGACIGGLFGWSLGRHIVIEPAYQPPPPSACYREVPGHWVERWYPGSSYPERVWVGPHIVRVPCPY